MKFTVLTLFPEIIEGFFSSSIMAKAVERGIVSFHVVNIRDFALDRHRTCDDAPYGGGAGMVLKAGPIARALDSLESKGAKTVYPTPSGRLLSMPIAKALADAQEIVLICGRYEGVDQRAIDMYVDEEISIGDYVISSGEVASLVIIDAVYRLVDGVINASSLEEESFENGLLEYPQYTRPEVFRGLRVPEVIRSGNHKRIAEWSRRQSVRRTEMLRPDIADSDERT